ncbi:hypothetical protein EDD11_010555 [Mortierella claussenii]|nr:hypothetical protein EDD11_010555 [Mortierella claussenii]
MDIDIQEQNDLNMDSSFEDDLNKPGAIEAIPANAVPSSKGEVLKILDQTIHDGGAVMYTVLWENGDTTEESVAALGKWDDLVQEYEHSQFSKSDIKSHTPSPPPSRKSQQSAKGESDVSKRRSSVISRPTRTKARSNVQYYEAEESDDGAEYSGSRSGKKLSAKSKKQTSSGDDGQDQDQDTPPATTLSARGYPRRAQTVTKPQPALDSSEGSSDEVMPTRTKGERKAPSAPKPKKTLVATSTESNFIQAHHPFCTRCGQRGEITKRKSKKKSDDEEDDEPLGSLLLCECCSAGYHRLCLRKTYTDSLIGTGFRCEACIKNKGAECLECHEWVGRTPPTPLVKASKEADPMPIIDSQVTGVDTPTNTTVMAEEAAQEATPMAAVEHAKDVEDQKDTSTASSPPKTEDSMETVAEADAILFRCFRCTYTAHDRCLRPLSTMDKDADRAQIVKNYRKDWKCHQCQEWDRDLDLILAFRDVPIRKPDTSATDDDTEMALADNAKPEGITVADATIKDGSTFPQPPNTTRELLIKWKNMSYRKVTWVPSYWVSQVVSPVKVKSFWKKMQGPAEIPDVVQPEWTQVDKVLDVIFDADYDGTEDDMEALDHIQSVFVKWRGLDYDQATWDEPDEPDSEHYGAFKQSFKNWVAAQKIEIPARAKKGRSGPQPRPAIQAPFEELKEQPGYVSGGTLKDYQMDGLNWLRYNHWKNVNSILADEMGLGKTIQMVAFVTTLFHQLKAFPCLIVVPNSTLTNWVREFAKWAPDLRVVAYYGPQTSRTVVREHELFHRGTQDLKCHVVVTTYEMIVNPVDSALFRKNSWECLVVDEGQRLKNENSMLFVKLNELVVENRVLLTGTPLQNNIRELFSLMNFLDPAKFSDVTELEKKYENLDKAAVEELHGLLKPFFLRRTKDEVLKDLPPKSEVIVPVGMSALQKEIYKGILARNHKLLQSITNRGGTASNRKASLHNILMELRKCLNHPYLIEGVEPRYLDTAELVHKSLIEAGGKLELLHNMLPKLKQNGHRVLIFSTMTRLLDILEDYLNGERYNFVRLDGSTSSSDRQARIDRFNAPDSDVFVFLLSTRAGGVGVNLATADTIIIYDVDFNPKADMQALSRAHRIGQKNKVLVLKFMTRNSAEERIVQIGKKKMILDHLIVERMEDDNLDPVDVESILKFGAKALFEEDSASNEDVKYDDAALDALLDRSKIEHNWDENDNGKTKVSGFGFAKVWTETKGIVDEDIPIDAPPETEEEGFWSTLLRDRLAMAYAQEEELLGRGARRKTVLSYAENGNNNESPPNKKRKAGKELPSKEEEDYVDQDMVGSEVESIDSDADVDPNAILGELELNKRSKKNRMPLDPNQSPLQPGDRELLDEDGRRVLDVFASHDGSLAGLPGHTGKIKKARMQPASPYHMQSTGAGLPGGRTVSAMDATNRRAGRKSQPCLVCNRSHRDRCPESQDIPLVLERRQQIATSNYPDNYKALALATLDRFLLDKQIMPAELPKGKTAKNLSAAAARLGVAAYQDSLRSMSIGKAFVPTITPGACIVCNQTPYHLPFKCPESRNIQFMQERCRSITLDPTILDAKKQEYVSTIKALISRELPRSNPPPISAMPSSRRHGPYPATNASSSSSHVSSRGGPASATASAMMAAAQASGGQPGSSSKPVGSSVRSTHGHHGHNQHQAYTSQIPPQFMSSRPKEHHGSMSNSTLTSNARPDSQRQRDYGPSGYHARGAPSSSSHVTSGARESSNYQPRKPTYRGDDGSLTSSARSSGYGSSSALSNAGGRGGQEYGQEGLQYNELAFEHDREHAGYSRIESSRHELHSERDRAYLRHEGRGDEVTRSHQDYLRADNGPYNSGAPNRSGHDRVPQHRYSEKASHPSSHYRSLPPSESSQQLSHKQQQPHSQHGGHPSSQPRMVSMSPREDHRTTGQPQSGAGPQRSVERQRTFQHNEGVIDLEMSSPTLASSHASFQSPQHQQQRHQQQPEHRESDQDEVAQRPGMQGRASNGDSEHSQAMIISPDGSPRMDRSSAKVNHQGSRTLPIRDRSPSYGHGGLVTAAAEDNAEVSMGSASNADTGYGSVGLKEVYHPLRKNAAKMNLATEHAAETMAPEALAAELRINEPHHALVDN